MFQACPNPYLVAYNGSFRHADAATKPPENAPDKKGCKSLLRRRVKELDTLQRVLYARDRYSVLLIFQAMDAAGKDSTIRAVMSGVDPAGCQVFSFKKPSPEELDHDFLWRTARCLPERGRIGIFNRSFYEEVLVVRVHPEFLQFQKLPYKPDPSKIWDQRYQSIRDHEKHLARNGTIILKFWLNVSREEQKSRFLSRIKEPKKNWKFAEQDVIERRSWDKYMKAYEAAVASTSRAWAPWYVIPADDKPFMRMTVAEIVVDNLKQLNLQYPIIRAEALKEFKKMRSLLEEE
jgi:PPK2 family polyphosphate:nucleotide phosphotransferase